MPPKIISKTKEQKAAAATSASKAKKKKWTTGKVRDTLNNAAMWDTGVAEKMKTEVPKWKVITASIISERFKVNGSLARESLRFLEEKGMIRAVRTGPICKIYTRSMYKKDTGKKK